MIKFQDYYKNEVINILMNKFKYSSVMQVPKFSKITLNMGIGNAFSDKKTLDRAIKDLTLISGQKPILTKAKQSISGFKIRKGYIVGCKVTLRKKRMWDFLERLLIIAIPRIRDFRGLSLDAFDINGNYNIGIREQIIFPEIIYDSIDRIRGMDISITTTAKCRDEGYALLSAFHFPFRKN
ncbi:50S ribosomal protein L5 [Candidatus Schneideria nysicola]|uniref:50S ribosomal protein L5 n=1 Tax=Candidatus Schneideria nysicola TaxID=1081631 RepID=UPI001CAA4258|nr:50S ribosomal protein L5 [Candidatus Schneideria nysicola]UAJ64930.1 50S ribosomal protein L5 [Candidatus Schneideria nysicola]